jgi:hypothetical protein
LKDKWGCEKRASKPVIIEEENGIQYNYWNCPIQFVTKSVWEFYKRYCHQKRFPSSPMPRYEDMSPKFIRAYIYFETKMTEYREKE